MKGKIVIATTPRTASTSIAEHLAEKHKLEGIVEYCNAGYTSANYSHNPKYGLKVMWQHVSVPTAAYDIEFAKKIYFLMRRDQFAQAVSQFFSIHTKFWYRGNAEVPSRIPKYDFEELSLHFRRTCIQNQGWFHYFEDNRKEYEIIWTEEYLKKLPHDPHPWNKRKTEMAARFRKDYIINHAAEWRDYVEGVKL